MGTRHLVGVVKDGAYRVAQYGQWDGYVEGQGYTLLHILHNLNIDELKQKIEYCNWVTKEKLDEYYLEVGFDGDDKNWTNEIADKFYKKYPHFSRDTGAYIIDCIMKATEENPIYLKNSSSFLEDDLFCEYAYIIDFDLNKFLCYIDGNKRLFASYDLDNLPTKERLLKDYENYIDKFEEPSY